jgi:hypothetical protein
MASNAHGSTPEKQQKRRENSFMKLKLDLIWPMLACIVLPLVAAWFVYPGTHLPPKFGVFPPEFVQDAPPFNLYVFILVALVGAGATLLLLFPRLFGFKAVTPPPPAAPAKLPSWFWIGAVFTLFFWWLMWARVTVFSDLVYYAFSPMWWGFILVLDGWAYRRSGGQSLLAAKPKMLFISAVVSVAGWFFFEFYDYFVLANWHYPNGHMAALPHGLIVPLFLIAYSTVWPAILEWYSLLNTFPGLVARYSDGPRLALPGGLLLWGGLALVVLMVIFPYPFFWAMWIGPLIALSGQLIRKNVWTPFTAMAQGNWSPFLLVAVASLFNGFFWEMWNYGSAHPDSALQTNPNYWLYNVPYVSTFRIFSEMPILGYYGYLPFGVIVWVAFIWAGKVFGFDHSLDSEKSAPQL